MHKPSSKILVVGGGAFGVSAALELSRRGHGVQLVDPGPLPHPDAASTDISKIVRADYGGDELYTELMDIALDRWRTMNEFHETGFALLTSGSMRPGGFEHDSYSLLSARGYPLERLDAREIARRFPAWREGRFRDGYYNPVGGWAESGAVMARLVDEARASGVAVREGVRIRRLLDSGGIEHDGGRIEADAVVLAIGTWTAKLLPELGDRLRSVGQPVFVFRPATPEPFFSPRFVPFGADIAASGWYGFCANADGLFKLANHGPGVAIDPDAPRVVSSEWEPRFREFLADALPSLAAAPVAFTRLCLYSDTFDGDFFIDRHPGRPNLVVAAGGSGHAFKFTPVLGELVADAIEGKPNRFAPRFAWRNRGEAKKESARFAG